MTHNRGYTLLEILLSLIIVATLSLVFVGVTQKMLQRNQIRSTALQMAAMTNAAIQYNQMYDQWPTAVTTLNSLLNTNLSCSPWKNASGCIQYNIISTATSHYFAVAVTTPSTVIATRLAANLPSAYQNGATVTAYATTFSGLPPAPIPTGVTLSANNVQLGTRCDTSTYSNPFGNCSSSTTIPYQSYGLIDLYAQNRNKIVSENVFAQLNLTGTNQLLTTFTDTTLPICPSGFKKTMFFVPAGIRTTSAVTGSVGTYAKGAMFSFRTDLYHKNGTLWQMGMSSIVGGTTATDADPNVVAGAGDIMCLPALGGGWQG